MSEMHERTTVALPANALAAHFTDDEQTLYDKGNFGAWGEAQDAVLRGAIYLDRVVPDWRSRVLIKDLDLSSPCRCVLGQIFEPYVPPGDVNDDNVYATTLDGQQPTYEDVWDGFGLGLRMMKMANNMDRFDDQQTPEVFLGFDHTDDIDSEFSYGMLQAAWVDLLANG